MDSKVTDISDDNAFEASTIEAAGILRDSEGNTFVVPDENLEDYDDLTQKDALAGLKLDNRFHYQTIRNDQVTKYLSEGWVLCSNKELGRADAVSREYGQAVDTSFRVGPDLLVKRPLVLHERKLKRSEIETLRQLAALEPNQAAVEAAQKAGLAARYTSTQTLLEKAKARRVALEPQEETGS